MSSHSSLRNFYARAPRTIGFVTLMAFAVAAMSYLPGALEQSAAAPLPSIRAIAPILIDDEWTGGPRECDVLNGISNACVFMD